LPVARNRRIAQQFHITYYLLTITYYLTKGVILLKRKTVKTVAIVVSAIFIGALLFQCVYSIIMVYAETDQQIINNAREKIRQAQENIKDIQSHKDQELGVKKELDYKINAIQGEIDILQDKIHTTQDEINRLNSEIDFAQQKVDAQDEVFRKRLRVMYEEGSVGLLDILLTAKNFADLISRIETVRTIAEYDKNILTNFKNDKIDLENKKELVEIKKQELDDAKAEEVFKRNELQGELDKVQEEIDRLTSDEDANNRAIAEAKKAEEVSKQNELNVELGKVEEEIDRLNSDEEANKRAIAESEKAEAEANRRIAQAIGIYVYEPAPGGGVYSYPFASRYIVTSGYGYRGSEFHRGIDIGAPYGTPVLAVSDGIVAVSEFNTGGYGNYVVINHGGGVRTLYAHHSSNAVSVGTTVSRGQVIAYCGSTGYSTGPHLHFEIQINGSAVNPNGYINF